MNETPFIPKGTIVRIKPEFQDGPEDACEFVTVKDSSRGRVEITAIQDLELPIPPIETVEVSMLCGF